MEKEQTSSHKHKVEVLEGSDKEFDIPPRHRSIVAKILIIFSVAIIIGAVGIGAYLYQKGGNAFPSLASLKKVVNETKSSDKPSVNETTEKDVVKDANDLIEDVNMATSVNQNLQAVSPTTTFDTAADKIYLTIQTKNFIDEHQIKVEWYYVDDDEFIDDGTYAGQKGINNVAFHLEQPASGSWPKGKYEVKIYVDGKLAQIARFEVKDTLSGSDVSSDSSESDNNTTTK